MSYMQELGVRARKAARSLAVLGTAERNQALLTIADALEANCALILAANAEDVSAAKDNGISDTMVDRLRLSGERIASIAQAAREIVGLADPVGRILDGGVRPNGLQITRITVPLGVVGIIFESRPNVTVDCAVLCLKSGNACILRGGKEAIHSNTALVNTMRAALEQCGISPDSVLLVEDTSREVASEMMQLSGYIDVLIPRGGTGLIQAVVKNATVPVIETGAGNCHIYVDAAASADMAVDIVENAKVTRPSVCNSLETLLVHRSRAQELLPLIKQRLDASHVEWRGCTETVAILGAEAVKLATEADWYTEYNDYILAVKIVAGLDAALDHIDRYSTHHSEAIVTDDFAAAQRFTREVDSAAVYVNASTRYTDGGEFGLGAEIGISTQKLHARGPMGLAELVSYKYVVTGSGQIR